MTSQDALVVKAQLELQEIDVLLLDEHSTMYAPNFANGSGGVRIQVKENQVDAALDFLIAAGHISRQSKERFNIVAWLSSVTSKIPLVKTWRIEVRLLFIAMLVFLPIVIGLAISGYKPEPSLSEKINGTWCVDSVTFKGRWIPVTPREGKFSMNGCSEYISFKNNGVSVVPGYGDVATVVKCNIHDNRVRLAPVKNDTTGHNNYLLGEFDVALVQNKLVLRSKTTKVILTRVS